MFGLHIFHAIHRRASSAFFGDTRLQYQHAANQEHCGNFELVIHGFPVLMGYKFKDILASSTLTQEVCRVLLNGQDSAKSLTVKSKLLDHFLSVQRELYQKAMKRLPAMAAAGCFFTRQALEQASSEPLAKWKANKMSGSLLYDLCGGLGADCLNLAAGFRHVCSCDPDEELNDLFAFNAERMGVAHVQRLAVKAESFLHNTEAVADWVYFDPDRRSEGRRQTGFKHYTPEPESLYKQFASRGKNWMIKLSPLDDIQAIYHAFPGLSRLWVMAHHGEVKELLAELQPGVEKAVSPELCVVEMDEASETHRLQAPLLPWPRAVLPGTGGDFLFEPSPGLIKSEMLQRNPPPGWISGNARGTLWFAPAKDSSYPGRWTEVVLLLENQSMGKSAAALKAAGISAASVKSREVPLRSEEVRKALRLEEGDQYRIYLSQAGKTRWLVAGKALRD
jgi:hypothetical protein